MNHELFDKLKTNLNSDECCSKNDSLVNSSSITSITLTGTCLSFKLKKNTSSIVIV